MRLEHARRPVAARKHGIHEGETAGVREALNEARYRLFHRSPLGFAVSQYADLHAGHCRTSSVRGVHVWSQRLHTS